jgi:two-component sensor histidine kinase
MAGEGAEEGQAPTPRVAELQHRLRNHLQNTTSLINLQIRGARHPETVQALEDLRARLGITGIYVDLDAGGETPLALDQFLTKVAHGIAALYDPMGRHSLSLAVAPLALAGQRALMVGQILVELLISAYRHGVAGRVGGKVWIELARHGADAILIVADDGHAVLDPHLTQFGFSMAASLVRALGGGIEHESRDSHVVRVRFPLGA